MKTSASVFLSVILLAASSAFATGPSKNNPFNQVLAAVPAAELPAKAAELVAHAKGRVRHATTLDVVRSAVGLNPAAAPAIVGAIARSVPDMAAVAAAVAATEQPKQAAAIAKAAAAAAPSKAGKIVTAVCRAVPNDYRNVAVAVAQVAPTATKDILKAVGTALPELKPGLDQALAGRGGSTVSVAATLDQAAAVVRSSAASATAGPATDPVVAPLAIASRLPNTPAPLARGPAVGPPYIPLSTTPTNVSPGTSGEVPTGGRDYAAP